MKYFKGLWAFINSKLFFLIIIALLFFTTLNKCSSEQKLKLENNKLEQNISASNDSITYYKNIKGMWVSEKEVFIKSEKELKRENKELYNNINKQDGKIISLNNTVVILKQDAILLQDSILYLNKEIGKSINKGNNKWDIPWKLEYTWDSKNHDEFKGITTVLVDTISNTVTHLNTDLIYRESAIDLIFGNNVVDGKYNVYVTSNYPGLSVSSMEGVFIDPNTNKDIKSLIEKKHWFTGFSVGVGVGVGINGSTTLGGGIYYNIYTW